MSTPSTIHEAIATLEACDPAERGRVAAQWPDDLWYSMGQENVYGEPRGRLADLLFDQFGELPPAAVNHLDDTMQYQGTMAADALAEGETDQQHVRNLVRYARHELRCGAEEPHAFDLIQVAIADHGIPREQFAEITETEQYRKFAGG